MFENMNVIIGLALIPWAVFFLMIMVSRLTCQFKGDSDRIESALRKDFKMPLTMTLVGMMVMVMVYFYVDNKSDEEISGNVETSGYTYQLEDYEPEEVEKA